MFVRSYCFIIINCSNEHCIILQKYSNTYVLIMIYFLFYASDQNRKYYYKLLRL